MKVISLILLFVCIYGIEKSTFKHKIGYILLILYIFSYQLESVNSKLMVYFQSHEILEEFYYPYLLWILLIYGLLGIVKKNKKRKNEAIESNLAETVKAEQEASLDNLSKSDKEQIDTVEMFSMLIKDLSFRQCKLWDSDAEEKVYFILKEFISEEYIILPHISINEALIRKKVKSNLLNFYYNRVARMHFDFAIYTKEFIPVMYIELCGGEHKKNKNCIENDNFKKDLFKANESTGIKLVSIDLSEKLSDENLKEKVIESIKQIVPDRNSYPVYCQNPRCLIHSKMDIRQNSMTKEYFYACKNSECGKTYSIYKIPPLYKGIPTIYKNPEC